MKKKKETKIIMKKNLVYIRAYGGVTDNQKGA